MSLSGEPAFAMKTSTDFTSSVLLTVKSLLDTGAGLTLVKIDFLPDAWKNSIKSIKFPQLRTASREIASKECIMLISISFGELGVRAWFVIVGNLAVNELLGT